MATHLETNATDCGDAESGSGSASTYDRGRIFSNLKHLLAFPGDLRTLSEIRHTIRCAADLHLRMLLRTHGTELADDIELMAGELIANAIRHSDSGRPGGMVFVGMRATEDGLRVEVLDLGGAGTIPRPVQSGLEEVGGRGLSLVEALSRRWGAERHGKGWRIWFEVAW
ncbi:ATP-binding protein [Bailinhaonella thermotolerans]|uniref:ATP-binding protein n=1 Tax=Bailinhaonella thermotolerans TaxID=1070861 RepID=UPI00192A5259|nr:ATP-binding protein [Bailinhaonella thermotolerans]